MTYVAPTCTNSFGLCRYAPPPRSQFLTPFVSALTKLPRICTFHSTSTPAFSTHTRRTQAISFTFCSCRKGGVGHLPLHETVRRSPLLRLSAALHLRLPIFLALHHTSASLFPRRVSSGMHVCTLSNPYPLWNECLCYVGRGGTHLHRLDPLGSGPLPLCAIIRGL